MNNRPIKRTREILINKKTLVTTEMDYKHLIFIHIPRCAGQTLTAYFTCRYGTPTITGKWQLTDMPVANNVDSALSKVTGLQSIISVSAQFDPKIPLQNQPLSILRSHRDSLGVPFNALTRIIVCVRNPYDRVISHMFSLGYINPYNSPEEVYTQMVAFFQKNTLPPQMSYVVDEFGNVAINIRILHVETLDTDMHSLGYTDFVTVPNRRLGRGAWTLSYNNTAGVTTPTSPDRQGGRSLTSPDRQGGRSLTYDKYLDADSKQLIQQIFDVDFRVFGYAR